MYWYVINEDFQEILCKELNLASLISLIEHFLLDILDNLFQ